MTVNITMHWMGYDTVVTRTERESGMYTVNRELLDAAVMDIAGQARAAQDPISTVRDLESWVADVATIRIDGRPVPSTRIEGGHIQLWLGGCE